METNKKTVLISGASIAGLTMAYWMKYYGYEVTVVEVSSSPRMGGTPIDVRGDALDSANRMGILEMIKNSRLPSMGLEFVNSQGDIEGRMLIDEISIRPGEDVEIRRDDLVNILYANAQGEIEYKFNNKIIVLEQDENKVAITFEDGTTGCYDLLIGADGLHSAVRKMVFGPEEQFAHFLNFYFTIMQVDAALGKENTGQTYNSPNHMATIYYYNRGFADALLAFKSSERINYDFRDTAAQKDIVINAFKNEGWKVPMLLEIMQNAKNFYFDQGCQIKMDSWTKGRVALIGDAAYAPGFPTGMGVTLALQGATVLADFIGKNDNIESAFDQYNNSFKDFVNALQATVYDGLAFLIPETFEDK
ncbi:hypothetical protein BCY89_04005 [Sphingobacterium siyangense]|uniref:FAD-binding domain-containing protein n=1 Tax=Sphingobacterium siyangense TaxID=459529 RepID=A0A420FV56_9SPHI|nr:FAD-dependent monooxygenase [Sphingobacterium siyangense]RKF36845.1 hypothetical protein BCY89_04005 [Sphingobacterium siyangense]